MTRNKLLHKVLESVDWDYVTRSFRSLGLQWYGSTKKVPTKKELTTDLIEIIEATFDSINEEHPSAQIVTPHWIVCAEKDEESEELFLEVIFTPFALFISSKEKDNKTAIINMEKLKQRLRIALEKESYEVAGLIQETLDNYNNTSN